MMSSFSFLGSNGIYGNLLNKGASSVSLSNVTVSTSINTKTKIIENQIITLKRQASNSLNQSNKKSAKSENEFQLSSVEYGLLPEFTSKLKFANTNKRLKKKNYFLNNGHRHQNSLNSTASIHSTVSDNESFIFNHNSEISPVKNYSENDVIMNNNDDLASESTATAFKIPKIAKFEFSLHKKLNDFRQISSTFSNDASTPTITSTNYSSLLSNSIPSESNQSSTTSSDIDIRESEKDEYYHFKPFEEYSEEQTITNTDIHTNTNTDTDTVTNTTPNSVKTTNALLFNQITH